MTTKNEILIRNGFIELPQLTLWQRNGVMLDARQALGTLIANLAAYGYTPNGEALSLLTQLSAVELGNVWRELEPSIRVVSGANRQMEDFVVYTNFPKEVLNMSQAQYWFSQICMYVGFPNEYFTQDTQERAPLNERLKLKVLHLANVETTSQIYAQLVASKARWTDDQTAAAQYLSVYLLPFASHLDITQFGFKENAINLMVYLHSANMKFTVTIPDATDVLRLAAGLSGSDPSLRGSVSAVRGRLITTGPKIQNLSRPVRRLLVNLLENSKNLEADVSARQDLFRELLMRLHPGDFKSPRVQKVYDSLYKGDLTTYNGQVERLILMREISVLNLLAQRPGEYARRLHQLFGVFNTSRDAQQMVADGQLAVSDRLTTTQLLKLAAYLRTVNERNYFMYPPKGNWSKVKIEFNTKVKLPLSIITGMRDKIHEIVAARVDAKLPQGVEMVEESRLDAIKLQTNDQELAPYGRGTEFDIPANMTFLRSASFWKIKSKGYVWFDNGWNFFDEDWKSVGACGWNDNKFYADGTQEERYSYYNRAQRRANRDVAAVFSGDPTNTKDLEGRACQMIDLYIDKLAQAGVRYAVWNILCYSRTTFNSAEDVLATLQWGEKPQEGNLYEPARAQMVFPLKGEAFSKYVAYIDVARRKLVYMDVNLPASTTSAGSNGSKLETSMPAFVEYLKVQPSVYDLFGGAKVGSIPILYSDEEVQIDGGDAYVFQKRNANNAFSQLDLTKLLV